MKLKLLILLVFLGACGAQNWGDCTNGCERDHETVRTEDCSVAETEDGATITCPDSEAVVSGGQPGKNGDDGRDGANGSNGKAGAPGQNGQDGAAGSKGDKGDAGPAGNDGAAGEKGADGAKGDTGAAGQNGQDGEKGDTGDKGDTGEKGETGSSGQDGTNGHSMVFTMADAATCQAGGTTFLLGIDSNDNGQLDLATDANVSSATICNGIDGENGEDGEDAPPTQFTPVEIINPCGDAAGIYDEVLLRFASGEILASFSDNANGKNTRLSLIVPGTYVTTDGSSCIFTVQQDGDVVW